MKPNNVIAKTLSLQVKEILPSQEGLERLMEKRKIRVYFGVDPTGTHLHLGHAIPLRKLRHFQDLGHEVILLFGTFTARIGDPTGKDEARKPLTDKEIKEHISTYKKQAGKILDLSQAKILRNEDWLGKLKLGEVLEIASRVTVARLLERDMFQQRIEEGREIWTHELLYPLLQGYDSVAMDVDLEIGGTDQTFNMLMGRRLQEAYNQKEKYILTTPLLIGLDGRKMSKSYGNTVNMLDSPLEMYGKLMSLRDDLMAHYFELCTDISTEDVERMSGELSPRDLKAHLACVITAIYHGEEKARRAEQEFEKIFRSKELPSTIPSIIISKQEIGVMDLLLQSKLCTSRNEAKRVIEQGGVKIDGKTAKEDSFVQKGSVVQKGKRLFVRVAQ
ncbi:MAG: tyrosine--tRNA ligase [bacterium]|nr:tyrosine--tRNA ligase [bacterium]